MDIEYLQDLSDGDIDIQKELVGLFFVSATKSLASMEVSLEETQTEQWKESAHELKGAALSLGFGTLATLCAYAQKAEHIDEENRLKTVEELKLFIKEIQILTSHLL